MARMHHSSKAKILLLVFSALVLTTGTAAASSSNKTCSLRVFTVDRDGVSISRHRNRYRRISAYETSRIELRAFCSAETPVSALTVKVFLPNGDLYEVLDPAAVEASPRRRRRRDHVASAELPLAGTLVTQYQLFGEWSAKVCRDDKQGQQCGRATRFTLEE